MPREQNLRKPKYINVKLSVDLQTKLADVAKLLRAASISHAIRIMIEDTWSKNSEKEEI